MIYKLIGIIEAIVLHIFLWPAIIYMKIKEILQGTIWFIGQVFNWLFGNDS